jgi:hypothetical protein
MSNIAYGFRPESGWPGVLFQVFLQGFTVESWRRQKDLEWWLVFNNYAVPCSFHELPSHIPLPDIGLKRYVVQCIVPEIGIRSPCSVTLNINAAGGKSLGQGLFLGIFTFTENGSLLSYLS